MHSEQKAIAIILDVLHAEGIAYGRTRSGVPKMLSSASSHHKPIRLTDLQSLEWMPAKSNLAPGYVIYLAPPNDRSIAALWYKWDFDPAKPISMCKFFYGVWRMTDPHPRPTTGTVVRKPGFYGYRFEPPEVQGTAHGFYHSQPCLSMGFKKDREPDAFDMDDRGPAMPIAAGNAIELLLCLYMAIYGADRFGAFATKLEGERRTQRHAALMGSLQRVRRLCKR